MQVKRLTLDKAKFNPGGSILINKDLEPSLILIGKDQLSTNEAGLTVPNFMSKKGTVAKITVTAKNIENNTKRSVAMFGDTAMGLLEGELIETSNGFVTFGSYASDGDKWDLNVDAAKSNMAPAQQAPQPQAQATGTDF